jgi:hypothetical protein
MLHGLCDSGSTAALLQAHYSVACDQLQVSAPQAPMRIGAEEAVEPGVFPRRAPRTEHSRVDLFAGHQST